MKSGRLRFYSSYIYGFALLKSPMRIQNSYITFNHLVSCWSAFHLSQSRKQNVIIIAHRNNIIQSCVHIRVLDYSFVLMDLSIIHNDLNIPSALSRIKIR